MNLSELAMSVNGTMHGENVRFSNMCTDTRDIQAGDLFVALTGEHFNGHDFVAEAFSKGAVAALVSENDTQAPNVRVSDTTVAFGLAAAERIKAFDAIKIAITGSCGKTTLKEMLATMLSQHGSVLATKGNFNNEIGVPKTLLSIEKNHDYAVVELGANHFGEIGYLSNLVKADIVVITNAARAHLEGFDSVEGVSRAKGEIFSGAKAGGVAILNRDDQYFSYWQGLAVEHKLKVLSVSLQANSDADLFLDHYESLEQGFNLHVNHEGEQFQCQLSMLGEHNILNALMAMAVAFKTGLTSAEVSKGVSLAMSASGRLNVINLDDDLILIDDTYNANPFSANAAVDVLAARSGKTMLVMGNMAELGEQEKTFHEEFGAYVASRGVDILVTVGTLAGLMFSKYKGKGEHFETHEQACQYIESHLAEPDLMTVLVKGSRSAKMDQVVNFLKNRRVS